MTQDFRGSLLDRSQSFADMVVGYRNRAVTSGFNTLFNQVVQRAAGEGLPDDVADRTKEYLKALAQTCFPDLLAKGEVALAGRADPGIRKALRTVSPIIGLSAAKLLLAGRAMGSDPDEAGLRLVDPGLTFEEARRYYQWRGTLVEARVGTVLSGPADPTKYFTLYTPDRQIMIRTSFAITICTRQYQ